MAMDGTVVERLIVEWRADYAKLREDVDNVKRELREAHDEAKRVTDSFRSVNNLASGFGQGLGSLVSKLGAVTAGLFTLRKAVDFVADGIKLAMDVVESDQLYEESLGRWADATRAWADEMQRALGVNAFEVRKQVGLWYTMTKSMGLTEEQALSMSKNLVQLKYDLASFYNLADERAETIIRGMISGETEPAKQIGVLLTEEMAKRALVTEGIIQEGQAVDSTTLMYGRYLALLSQTSTAHGDMARTIDSPANQLRVMQAALRGASLEMGQAFLPVLQAVIPWLAYVAAFIRLVASALASLFGVRRSSGVAAATKSTTEDLKGISAGVQAGAQDWDAYGRAASGGAGKAKQAVKELQATILGFDSLNKMVDQSSSGGIGGGGGALSPGGAGGIDLGALNADFAEIGDELARWRGEADEIDRQVREFLRAIAESPIGVFGQTILDVFGGIYNDILLPLGSWLLQNTEFAIGALEGILVGVLSFKAAGLIFGPGSPVALGIGIIGGLAGAVDGFLRESERKRMLEDMAGRWGDIALNADQVDTIIRSVFETLGSQLAREALEKTNELALRTRDWQRALEGVIAQTYTFSLGVKMTDQDKEDIKRGIDAVLEEAHKIFDEAKLNLPLTFSNVNLSKEVMTALQRGYDDMEKDFVSTGELLRKAFDNAIADGIITDEEFDVIRKLQLELQEILRKAADIEAEVALEQIYRRKAGSVITEDSFRQIQERAQEYIDELNEINEQLLIKQIGIVRYSPTLSIEEKESLQKQLEDYYDQQDFVLNLKNIKLQLNFLSGEDGAFPEIERIQKALDEISAHDFRFSLPDWLGLRDDLGDVLYSQRFISATKEALDFIGSEERKLVDSFSAELADAMQIDDATRKNIASFYESLLPSSDMLMGLFNEAFKAGETIPEGVSAGLISVHSVGAVAGNIDSLMFMIGYKLSRDPAAVEVYEEAKASGKKINEFYAAGMEAGKTLPAGVTDEMLDQLILALESGGDEVIQLVNNLGYATAENLGESTERGTPLAIGSMKKLIAAVTSSVGDHLGRDRTAVNALTMWMAQNEGAVLDQISAYTRSGMSLADALITAYSKTNEADTEGGKSLIQWMNNNKDAINNNFHLLTIPSSELSRQLQQAFARGILPKPPKELNDWLLANQNTLTSKIVPYMNSGMSLSDAIVAAFNKDMRNSSSSAAINEWATATKRAADNNYWQFDQIGTNAAYRIRSSLRRELEASKISVDIQGNVKMRFPDNYTWRTVAYAAGGFPETGELFVAREAGPELVGRMGSRAAVANNDQIVAGIEAGVFNAVTAALSGIKQGGGTTIVPVYIGPEKIYEAIVEAGEKRSVRAGRRL